MHGSQQLVCLQNRFCEKGHLYNPHHFNWNIQLQVVFGEIVSKYSFESKEKKKVNAKSGHTHYIF